MSQPPCGGRMRPSSARANERLKLLALDVTNSASIGKAIADATAAFGAIDVLVNNAGIGWSAPLKPRR